MFKIEKTETINKTFRIPADLIDELKSVAKLKGVSMNSLVIRCCKYALKHLDKD